MLSLLVEREAIRNCLLFKGLTTKLKDVPILPPLSPPAGVCRAKSDEKAVRSRRNRLPVLLLWPESCRSRFWLSAGHWHPLRSKWWGQTWLACSWHRQWWIGQSQTIERHLKRQSKKGKMIKTENIPALSSSGVRLLPSKTEPRHRSCVTPPLSRMNRATQLLGLDALCSQGVLCPRYICLFLRCSELQGANWLCWPHHPSVLLLSLETAEEWSRGSSRAQS